MTDIDHAAILRQHADTRRRGHSVNPDVLRAAAAEIERLRKERDEARRMVCEKEETLGCDERGVPRNGSARDHAKRMRWDCFKENSDD